MIDSAGGGNARVHLTPWRLTLQIVGFIVGLGLLAWCILRARDQSDLARLGEVSPGAIAALVACTLVSVVANGAIFWSIIQPVSRLRFLDVQLVNCVVNLLNYAPVRLGVLTRLAHHRRVDRLDYLTLVAWYASVALIVLMMMACLVASTMLATMLRGGVDLVWGVIFAAMLLAGSACLVWISSHHVLARYLRGTQRLMNHRGYLTLTMTLRIIDMVAYSGRLYLAFGILGITLPLSDLIYLAIISMLAGITPVGNLGFRDWAVAFFAPLLISPELAMEAGNLEELRWAAVLVDRAAEAVVFIPLGIIGLIWMYFTWSKASKIDARRGQGASSSSASDQSRDS